MTGGEEFELHIPQDRAEVAIKTLSRQTGYSVIFQSSEVEDVKTNSLSGRYTLNQALESLFQGTMLTGGLTKSGVITVSRTIQSEIKGGTMNKTTNRKSVFAAITATLAALFAPANTPAQEGASGTRLLEEVMVTARRVEERLQDTPIAVTAFTPETLEKRQIFSTDLLDQVTPNLQFTNVTTLAGNNASSVVFIRGIGQVDPTSSVDPGVGLYIDDVYMSQSIGGSLAFRDIAGVQVLRGPQGTLFGKNTVGGAILLTTHEPGDEFGGNFSTKYIYFSKIV